MKNSKNDSNDIVKSVSDYNNEMSLSYDKVFDLIMNNEELNIFNKLECLEYLDRMESPYYSYKTILNDLEHKFNVILHPKFDAE
jgi:hypothetical protein